MIYSESAITNPWFKHTDDEFHTYYCKEEQVSKHKCYCFQVSRYRDKLIGYRLNISWRGKDHAGFEIEFTLLGRTVNFHTYDTRHWNNETNNWYTKEEAEAEAKELHNWTECTPIAPNSNFPPHST
jgi:hypothetical protein